MMDAVLNQDKHAPSLGYFNTHDSLILGIGNDGRQDDGLGWVFIAQLEQLKLCPNASLERRYQLLIEDAELISRYKRVLLVDASRETHFDDCELKRIQAKWDATFTSHSISPESILATCEQCYQLQPEVWFFTVRGYEWDFGQELSAQAADNLRKAWAYLT